MAITPKEALGDKLKAEQTKINELEAKCDEKLRQEWTGRGIVTVDADGYNQFVLAAVQRRFQTAGWIVKQHDDQRDGCHFSFEQPTQRTLAGT